MTLHWSRTFHSAAVTITDHAGNFRETVIPEACLSELPEVSSPADLLTAADAIFKGEVESVSSQRHLDDLGGRNYVLSLRNATFYPKCTFGLHRGDKKTPKGLARPLRRSPLLLPGNGRVITDSFFRSRDIDKCMSFDGVAWRAALPAATDNLAETALYIEFIPKHFGHALIDLPGRLWPFAHGFTPFDSLPIVGGGTHGLTNDRATWPRYLRELIAAYGIDESRIRVLERPTRIEHLIVPKRISPFHGAGGREFNAFLQSAGDKLEIPTKTFTKIYLSRSRVVDPRRLLENEEVLDGLFERCGFAVIHPQELPLGQQVHLVRAADVIAGCAGTALHLIAFRRPGRPYQLLRIAPSFFSHRIDAAICCWTGGDMADLVFDKKKADGRLGQAWALTVDELAEIRAKAEQLALSVT